ncbi:DUF5320 domain-containing protein [Archaeoglobus neptunius]|uniref:DUF5320 domain-containing protein n=1 Tax=Archaeoglobus neptunius TaxID=2798580 RepID=UPI0019265B38|nr:DUF5320 domain-containing protein [Archaeoglobus neptunius]
MPWWMPGWGGRGWRWWYRATCLPGWMRWGWWEQPPFYPPSPTYRPEDELEMLEAMKEDLEAELKDITKRIEELKRDLER